jgi:medium-chain acyl-[acyl-carrier-protein] hydrolase
MHRFSETASQRTATDFGEGVNTISPLASDAALYRPKPRNNPSLRLFCFPHAGGGAAAFRLWPNHLSEEIEVVAVHPPGRAHRLREPPLSRIETMVESALVSLGSLIDRPFAIFGHSLGAVVAGEFARVLQIQGRPAAHLFVSSRPSARVAAQQFHQLPDDDFLAAVNAHYQSIPEEILAHADVLALLLPSLRADLEALETFRLRHDRAKIECPTTVYGGEFDRTLSRAELESWNEETAELCRIRVFPGDHFYYLNVGLEAMLADLSTTLEHLTRPAHVKQRHEFGSAEEAK